jgi:hypothetical protein
MPFRILVDVPESGLDTVDQLDGIAAPASVALPITAAMGVSVANKTAAVMTTRLHSFRTMALRSE